MTIQTHAREDDASMAWSLRRRMTVGLLGYALLLTIGILANDFVVNESAEHLAWESLLTAELDYILSHRQDEKLRPFESEVLQLISLDQQIDKQNSLLLLKPGIHDEVEIDGRKRVILVRDEGAQRFILALDITDLEGREAQLRNVIFASAFFVVVLLGFFAAWGTGRLLAPLRQLGDRIGTLHPENGYRRVALPKNSSRELATIVKAMNLYIERNVEYIERERTFSRVASHELRTPIAIIAGAAQLALNEPDVPDAVRKRLSRIKETTDDANELVALLLVLAKDPERLVDAAETIHLHTLLPQIARDHMHLSRGKEVSILLGELPEITIVAPMPMVKSAIGNLLRNAIENTVHGDVMVSLDAQGAVIIEDHGPGISAEKMSELYTRMARGEGLDGGGIGLQFIARLCDHLKWELSVDSRPGKGTRMVLRFSRQDGHPSFSQ